MRRLAAAVLLCGSAVLVTGCFDIEQTLTLERNLSGKAGFTMKVDMEPMVGFMAGMQKSMSGKTGDPTPEEIAAARKDILASSTSSSGNFEKEKKDLAASLPPGVTLIDATMKDEGLKMTASMLFGFDKLDKLSQIKLPSDPGAGPGGGSPVQNPFDGLTVTDQGATILVTSTVANPMEDVKSGSAGGPPMDPEMMKQVMSMFGGLRVACKITAPFEVVEHNATRKEGNTLIWEYDVKALSTMKAEDLKKGIRVVYKK